MFKVENLRNVPRDMAKFFKVEILRKVPLLELELPRLLAPSKTDQ